MFCINSYQMRFKFILAKILGIDYQYKKYVLTLFKHTISTDILVSQAYTIKACLQFFFIKMGLICIIRNKYIYSGTCLIRHTKGPGKCVGLHRMSENSGFLFRNLHKFNKRRNCVCLIM